MKRAALLLAAHLVASPVAAHDWYDPNCCNGDDCAPVSGGSVKWTPKGWRVEVKPGEHPMAPHGMKLDAGDHSVRAGRDRRWHVCINCGWEGCWVTCIYAPIGG